MLPLKGDPIVKLGYIDYLNCYPFYFHMFEREPLRGVDIIEGYPSDLNRMMAKGELNMSPISAATSAELNGQISLLPDFCLSSEGYVGSVILRSRMPIEALHHKIVGITSASHTSVVLLKILLKRYYHIEPTYITTDPNPSLAGMDAVLLIGNEAMISSREPVQYSYDLGDLWLRKTGFPVIFAVFTVQNSIIEKYSNQIASVIASYRRSLHCLDSERQWVISHAQERYPDISYDISSYYNVLRFRFTDKLKEALRFFFDAARTLELLPGKESLNYIDSA